MQTITPNQIRESMRLNGMTEKEIVADYLRYPLIPYKETIRIDKIALLNFNFLTKEKLGAITYKTFRDARPEEFPACEDPELDYEDGEQVAPALLISGDKKYRVPQKLWFPLADAAVDITNKQARIGRKLLPIEVLIDERDQWMVPLFNVSRR